MTLDMTDCRSVVEALSCHFVPFREKSGLEARDNMWIFVVDDLEEGGSSWVRGSEELEWMGRSGARALAQRLVRSGLEQNNGLDANNRVGSATCELTTVCQLSHSLEEPDDLELRGRC